MSSRVIFRYPDVHLEHPSLIRRSGWTSKGRSPREDIGFVGSKGDGAEILFGQVCDLTRFQSVLIPLQSLPTGRDRV